MRYILILCLCLFLNSCASTLTLTYDETGRVERIAGKGAQDSTVKQGDVEVSMDNKAEPFKDIINIQGFKN